MTVLRHVDLGDFPIALLAAYHVIELSNLHDAGTFLNVDLIML
jgi:hypothetical protein